MFSYFFRVSFLVEQVDHLASVEALSKNRETSDIFIHFCSPIRFHCTIRACVYFSIISFGSLFNHYLFPLCLYNFFSIYTVASLYFMAKDTSSGTLHARSRIKVGHNRERLSVFRKKDGVLGAAACCMADTWP